MIRCPNCGGSMETDDPNDADYVVYGHVVCGRICYDAITNHPLKVFNPVKERVWDEQLELPLHLDTG